MVFVLSKTGKQLMPTTEYRARKLLKKNRAEIYKYRPFTIRLTEREDGDVQPIEYACDTGYQHIGISIKSAYHEYVNEQRDLLKDETERHNDCRKYRRTRRNRLRYRKARWNNRRSSQMCKDGFAPGIRNKRDVHIRLVKMYQEVCPVTRIIFELGQFDTQALKAVEEGRPLPQGADYQHGERYGISTLREAVFYRDDYTCQCCGKSAIKDGVILRVHHCGYWKGDRTNRLSNLMAVCDKCHTGKNHKEGGMLYGLVPKLKTFKGASFMTGVKYSMIQKLKETSPDTDIRFTFGAATKVTRSRLNISKSHSNDAYCMGDHRPKHRCRFRMYQKRRRNSRILSKFYDAKFIDERDGTVKSGNQLGSERTSRKIPRSNPNSLRKFRGQKISKGRVSVRKTHYSFRPGDIVWYEGKRYVVKGVQNKGSYVSLQGHKPVPVKKITKCIHVNGWAKVV